MIATADTLLKPGDLFADKYKIERFLAQGGHGAVFVAEHVATEAPVAVKVLWPHLQSPDLVTRFELEAKVAGRVRSEFIVRTLDAGSDRATGLLYLVMELLEGQSLADRVRDFGPCTPVETVTYLLQAAHGLDKAHSYVTKGGIPQPIVHRDLKPANLFLCHREDGEPIVKILDFGIAKILSESGVMSQDIKATPLFMAYEQAAGGPVSPSTDVWALGLTAFFLMTGRPYWRSGLDGISMIFAEVLNHPIIPPTERAREFGLQIEWPAAFDRWFLRCVHRDPSERFQRAGDSASALAESLLGDAWAATLPLGLRFDSGVLQASSAASTPPPAVVVGSSTTMGTAAERPEPHKRSPLLPAALVVLVLAGLAIFGLRRGAPGATAPSPSQLTNGAATLETPDVPVNPEPPPRSGHPPTSEPKQPRAAPAASVSPSTERPNATRPEAAGERTTPASALRVDPGSGRLKPRAHPAPPLAKTPEPTSVPASSSTVYTER